MEGLQRLTAAWWFFVLLGLLAIVAGVIVIVQPGISLVTLAWISGIFLLVDGAFQVGASLSRTRGDRGLLALLGVLSIIAGLVLVRHPFAGVVWVALALGIWFVVFGIVRFIDAFDSAEKRVWHVATAVLELTAGVIILSVPEIGIHTLAVIVAIGFMLRGAATIAGAWALRAMRDAVRSGTNDPKAPEPAS
jgi:uncharacterized membrane protein HdeD (DUF308 family)